MGGWRKMYFILQNQLLLSYSSKDDYEKKLAPFKDIINLVPGTVIIPTTGPRFTIETNSKVLYTFRCDDHKSCSEWITALLDSLKGDGGGGSGDKKYSHLSKGLHGGNLHHQLSHRSLSSLSSSSSSASSTASCYATDDPSKMAITSIRRLQQQQHQNLHSRPLVDNRQLASLSAPNLFYGFASNGNNVKIGKLVQLPVGVGAGGGDKKFKILTINEVEDDGENDEKPATVAAPTTTTTTSLEASRSNAARSITSNGIRGDKPKANYDEPDGNEQSKTVPAVGSEHVAKGGETKKPEDNNNNNNSNFRLHPTNLEQLHQSSEVCRINSMFGGGGGGLKKLSAAKRFRNAALGLTNGVNDGFNLAASTGDLRPINGAAIGPDGGGGAVAGNNNRGITVGSGSVTDLRKLSAKTKPAKAMMTTLEPKPLTDINHNNLAKWSAESITIELTANGFHLAGAGKLSAGSTDTLYRKASSASEKPPKGRSRSNSHNNLSSSQPQQLHTSRTNLNRSPAAAASSTVEGRAVPSKRSNGGGGVYEEIAEPVVAISGEPIYAVVDLSAKKARRLNQRNGGGEDEPDGQMIKVDMVRDSETGRLKEKSKSANLVVVPIGGSYPVGNNDYEELNELALAGFANFGDDQENSNDGENIYEPINIPETPLTSSASPLPQPAAAATSGGSSQMNNLWRNLKKMNINQLIKRNSPSKEDPRPSPVLPNSSQQNQRYTTQEDEEEEPDETEPEEEAAKTTTFSELSKKFGHHRRSIKNKMRVLVDRGGQQPSPTCSDATTASKMSASDERLRKASDSRALFATFGRNKKSRKSLSFDDFIPRKKHHHHYGGGVGVLCKSDKVNNDKLHKELKRQLSKRSDSSSGGGSSINENKNSIEL
ncbi:uncharacterized protein LOC120413332 isoform X2 [Culex pipiens pallens]|nr:uncharacterized protein LOC120413332 isoform X2 [Culex pipiens pallens]